MGPPLLARAAAARPGAPALWQPAPAFFCIAMAYKAPWTVRLAPLGVGGIGRPGGARAAWGCASAPAVRGEPQTPPTSAPPPPPLPLPAQAISSLLGQLAASHGPRSLLLLNLAYFLPPMLLLWALGLAQVGGTGAAARGGVGERVPSTIGGGAQAPC
jgi:hypothetical protein